MRQKSKKQFIYFKMPKFVEQTLGDIKERPASFWQKRGQKKAMELYRFSVATVPAYGKFLRNHSINPTSISTIKDFLQLPVMDKKVYLREYEYNDLFPNRDIGSGEMVSATSGTTGKSFYFPRRREHGFQYEYAASIFLKNQFEVDKKNTCAIIGFGMGVWIGGMYTYETLTHISASEMTKGITTIPIGPNIPLFLETIKSNAGFFDQLLLVGYPPFIKDALDQGEAYGILWKNYNIKILTAAEGFSEKFRNYLAQKVGIKNIYTDIINIYGTVELGAMANETALTTLIRKLAEKNKQLFKEIFSTATGLPTLAQYHPEIVYFEEQDGEILATGYGSCIPLLRYRFPDRGGVIPFDFMVEKFKKHGIDLFKEAKKVGIRNTVIKLPFVFVQDRSDGVLIVRGVKIHPHVIKNSLLSEMLQKFVTGKFYLKKKESEDFKICFECYVELKSGVKSTKSIAVMVQKALVTALQQKSSEYLDQYNSFPGNMRPEIKLLNYQDDEHFSPQGKHKWVE